MTNDKLDRLQQLRNTAVQGGGADAIERQHKKGKLTARERLDVLLDDGSFHEMGLFVGSAPAKFGDSKNHLGDGLVGGAGRINGRRVIVYSQDFTVMGGSLGERHAEKILKLMAKARALGIPIVGIFDSGGARIQEGVQSLAGYASIFRENTISSGVIPQIAVILGPCAGGAVYSPGLQDFTFMVSGSSHMFLTGPDVIKTVLHEEISFEDLGGASVHTGKSGVAHFRSENEVQCLKCVRDLLGYLPSNNKELAPRTGAAGDDPERRDSALGEIVPLDPGKPYEIKGVITSVMD
nr:methylmalonyl-CoA carboxyltransferase [bacterium]